MLAASEWSRFASQRKGLRTSSPTGSQRSTYWLQLPWKYSLPLGIVSALLHWLVSQSIFLVKIDAYGPYQEPLPDAGTLTCGYSSCALFITIIIGGIMLLPLAILGSRTLDARIPLAGSCSLAISAACHQPLKDNEASRLPIQWGAVSHEAEHGPGHCCFTSFDVEPAIEGQMYR